jgi:two-component system, NtrC family, sensor kinase
VSALAISGTRPPLVLVVDDNEAIRYSFCRTLRRAGIEAIEAGTGEQALSAVGRRKPDLIILDLKLPDISGYEVGRRIKSDPVTQHTLVLHASATFVDPESRLRALENADGYLAQPVSSDELLATVRAMLRTRRADGEGLSSPAEADDVRQDLRAALEALREKNQVLEALVQASPLPIMAFDEERRVSAWNNAAEHVFGWSHNEILGRPLPIITPQRESEFDAWSQQLWRERRSFVGFETVAHKKQGGYINVAISAAPVTDIHGRANGLMMILEDISSRKRGEELLRRNEKLIEAGRMAAALAHEINNPLSSVVNLMYLLDQNGALDEHAREYLHLAQEELGRVVHISKQILGMHRESATLTRVSLAGLTDNVLELYAQTIRMRHISVHKCYRTDGEVMGYPGELRQVFSNLMTNALEVLDTSSGRLAIHISPALQWDGMDAQKAVRLTISDNGPGIPRHHRRNIFEPFFTTKGEKGTGLGLWVVKGILEKHRGTVRIRTRTQPGKSGTCFTILLPADGALRDGRV